MCPVCYYGAMPDPPMDYNICPCCGTEFENHDEFKTHAELRQEWIAAGAKWFFRQPPPFWNPQAQLARVSHYWEPIQFQYATFGKTVMAFEAPIVSLLLKSSTTRIYHHEPSVSDSILGSTAGFIRLAGLGREDAAGRRDEMKLWKWLICLNKGHLWSWMRAIYGDEIIEVGWHRNWWRCDRCGMIAARGDTPLNPKEARDEERLG